MNKLTGLEPRTTDSHKGNYGRLLFIGGCRNMSGAIAMSASAALRSGAGLVTVATPSSAQPIVAGYNPCYMTIGISEDTAGTMVVSVDELGQAVEGLEKYDVLAIGPGLSQNASLVSLVNEIYRQYDGPMVIDADGLNNLTSLNDPAGSRVLTPHPGEFRRLLGRLGKAAADQPQQQQARDIAAEYGLTVLLKGSDTLVTNGTESYYNSTGNPGMATAGSGDVLTGVIASLLAQQIDPLNAAFLGAHLHGLAGDLAVEDIGEVSLIATDLIEYLPVAFQQYQAGT
tara:strand:- start:576 stop:1430 length:855 start_codon:yes stop_codon:yes gene_type:complete